MYVYVYITAAKRVRKYQKFIMVKIIIQLKVKSCYVLLFITA